MDWNNRRWDLFIFGLFIILLTSIGMLYNTLEQDREDMRAYLSEVREVGRLLDNNDRYALYDVVKDQYVVNKTKLLGLYHRDNDIYCVYGKKNPFNFSSTDLHEHWHYMIDQNECHTLEGNKEDCKEHFCK